ncbi:hypothetical protein ACOIWI_004293 [Vibrio vulnificus]|nr:hypothetical protein [Vibrio vulnificus]ELX4200138.1 hypothetical protein [Vibrio vulnificus]
MASYFSQILNVTLVFLVTLLLNFCLEYFTSDKGVVRVGNVMQVGEVNYKPIDIENFSSEPINKLKLLIPKDVMISSLVVSTPLEVDVTSNLVTSKSSNIIEISSIPSHAVTRVLIPIKEQHGKCCEILNDNELNLLVKNDGQVNNPLKNALYQALTTAIISAVILGFFMAWFNGKVKRIEEKEKETLTALNENKSSLEEFKRKIDDDVLEVKKLNKRQRIYLLKRITEYSKEIDFWRDTFRKVASNSVSNEQITNLLIDISKSLGTRSTHGNAEREYAEFEIMFDVVSSVSEESKI